MFLTKDSFTTIFKRFSVVIGAYCLSGKHIAAIAVILLYVPFLFFLYLFLFLDSLFYRKIENKQIENPVIILGHPRSGTTFMQKLISDTESFAFSTLYSLIFPSIILMKILKPAASFFSGLKIPGSEEKGHKMKLFGIEEDEGLFLHTFNSEILTIFCPWLLLNKKTADKGMRLGWNDLDDKTFDFDFLKDYLKRRLIFQNKSRALIKTNPSVFRMKKLLQAFPTAQFVYISRAPEETIPSFLSFHYNYLRKRIKSNEISEYLLKKYEFSRELYSYFDEIKYEIPESQLSIINFEDLKNDTVNTLKKLYAHLDIQPDAGYWKRLTKTAARKPAKKHNNLSLDYFGITPEMIKKDFSSYYFDELVVF